MDELAKLTIEHQEGGRVRSVDVAATPPRMSDATIEMLSQVVGGDGYAGPNALVEDLIALERTYQGGRPAQAREHAERVLLSTDNHCLILLARTNHMFSSVALGDAETAYDDLTELYWRCQEGLEYIEDGMWRGLSLICALRMETLLAANILESEQVEMVIETLHPLFKDMIGYLLALRAMRNGHHQVAAGIVYAYLITASKADYVAQITHHALLSAACTIDGMREGALKHFSAAWDLRGESDFIMPLVSLNYFTLGVQRCLGLTNGSAECKRMEDAVRRYNRGWFALRGLCGLHTPLESLTLLECYALGLAVVGWRNKEIASFLKISSTR